MWTMGDEQHHIDSVWWM